MKYSVVTMCALVAVAVPAFAYPSNGPSYAFAREATDVEDQSGALRFPFGPALEIAGHGLNFFNGLNSQQKRELVDILARDAEVDESGAIRLGGFLGPALDLLGGLINNKRELEDLLARNVEDDESGALGLSFSGIGVPPSIFNGHGPYNKKRELEDLLARDVEEDESGAIKLPGLFGVGLDLLGGLFNNKRELEELLGREESGAPKFKIPDQLRFGPPLPCSLVHGPLCPNDH